MKQSAEEKKRKLSEWGKLYYQKNKEVRLNARKEYYRSYRDRCEKDPEYKQKRANLGKLYRERKKDDPKWVEGRKVYARKRDFKKKYGITPEDYTKMIIEQDNKCKICGKEEVDKNAHGNLRTLSVDHCHDSGQVRGLLCNKCNRALGYFKDSIDTLKEAIKYLEKNK